MNSEFRASSSDFRSNEFQVWKETSNTAKHNSQAQFHCLTVSQAQTPDTAHFVLVRSVVAHFAASAFVLLRKPLHRVLSHLFKCFQLLLNLAYALFAQRLRVLVFALCAALQELCCYLLESADDSACTCTKS